MIVVDSHSVPGVESCFYHARHELLHLSAGVQVGGITQTVSVICDLPHIRHDQFPYDLRIEERSVLGAPVVMQRDAVHEIAVVFMDVIDDVDPQVC